MKEVARPIIDRNEPEDESMARIARYAEELAKQNQRLMDIPLGRNKMEGVKRLENTGHDIALKRANTIHDEMARNPALYARLCREFGR